MSLAKTVIASSIVSVARYPRYFIPLILVLVIQACGFQLRGALEISPEVSPLYLQQNSAFDLGREVKQLLITNKVELTDSSQAANSQLILLGERKSSRVLSVGGDGRVREYLLSYTVNYLILFKTGNDFFSDGGHLGAEQLSSLQSNTLLSKAKESELEQLKQRQETVTVRRTLLYNQNAVLAVANETEILYKEMRRDVARLILLKVQARSKDAERKSAETAGDRADTGVDSKAPLSSESDADTEAITQ